MKNGEVISADIPDHHEFENIVLELKAWWGDWVRIGYNAMVRKESIDGIYYSDGYEERDS